MPPQVPPSRKKSGRLMTSGLPMRSKSTLSPGEMTVRTSMQHALLGQLWTNSGARKTGTHITTYPFRYRGQLRIGSCRADIGRVYVREQTTQIQLNPVRALSAAFRPL